MCEAAETIHISCNQYNRKPLSASNTSFDTCIVLQSSIKIFHNLSYGMPIFSETIRFISSAEYLQRIQSFTRDVSFLKSNSCNFSYSSSGRLRQYRSWHRTPSKSQKRIGL